LDASELDRKIDEGEEDILDYFDPESETRPNRRGERVDVDFPEWVVEALDAEARRLGMTRPSIIKVWIAERLERAG
jgi:hypothetical protein